MRKKRRTGYFITVAALVCSLIGNSVVVSMAADQEYSEVEVQENKNPDNAGNENETDKVMDSDEPTEEPTEEPAEDLAEEDSTETDSEMKDDAELKDSDQQEEKEMTMRERLDLLAEENKGLISEGNNLINTVLDTYMAMNTVDGGTKNGTAICLWNENLASTQQWEVICDETGYLTFLNKKSGKVLDVSGGNAKSGTAVQLYDANGTYAQKWIAIEEEAGIRLVSALDENLVLDVVNGKSAQGTRLQIWSDNGTPAQRWKIRTVEDIYTEMDQKAAESIDALADGIYVIRSGLSRRQVLDVSGGSKDNSANIQIYESNTTAAQKWKVTHDEKGYLTFINMGSGKALDVVNGLGNSGNNVAQYTSNGTRAQKWIAVRLENGKYLLYSALTENLVIDVTGANIKNGSNVQVYRKNETTAQQFLFTNTTAEIGTCEDLGISENWYEIVPKSNEKSAVDISGASSNNGANAQIYSRNQTYAQLFKFVYEEGYYRILCAQTDKVLEVAGGDVVPGTNIRQWSSVKDKKDQLFSVCVNEDGTYTFKNVASGLTVSLANKAGSSGTNLQGEESSEGDEQRFYLVRRTNLMQEGIYSISTCLDAGKWLDVKNGSMSDGAGIQIWQGNESLAQKWKITAVEGRENTYSFESLVSGLMLTADVNGNVVQKKESGEEDQQWMPTISKGYLILKNVGNGKVLDVAGGTNKNGTKVQTYAANSTNAQRFRIDGTSVIANGIYLIQISSNRKQVIDVSSGSRKSGANIQTWESNNTGAQKWNITRNSDGTYSIVNAKSKKYLDVLNGSGTAGANVQQWDGNGSNAQKWKITYTGKGEFRISSVLGDALVLDVSGENSYNGANVQVYTDNAGRGQRFSFVSTSYTPEPVNLGVPCVQQYPELPTGCESVALTNVLKYYGYNIGKSTIADSYLPRSSWNFVTCFWGNPHSSNGNCTSAPGLTNAANGFLKSHGSNKRAYDVSGSSWQKLYDYLDEGNPVIIWTTIYQQFLGACYASQWYNGKEYKTYTNSHTVVLKGYDRNKNVVYLSDSISGYLTEDANWISMLYTARGMQAVVIR